MKSRYVMMATAVVLGAYAGALMPPADGQEAFPDEPGRDTLILACTQCHSLGKMMAVKATSDDWEFLVYDMIARGAPVHQEDIADLTAYLQNNFATDRD